MRFVRVFLIDNHQMLTDALAARLSVDSDIWVVGRGTPGDPELLDVVAKQRPDVIITELQRAGTAAVTLLPALAEALPQTRLVVLTECRDASRAVDAARAGVSAWVHKDSPVEHLVDVLRRVLRGQACYPPEQLGDVLRELRDDVRRARERTGPLDALTDREREVLASMVAGKRPAQIAADLYVSANTVRTHIGRILAKLGVRSSLEAVSVALSTGLLPGAGLPTPVPTPTPKRDDAGVRPVRR
ncbi:MAG: response regulator transcription factor [Sciscionella sp.]|nr:response regulator transcription factor [Sciscionella sp.]